MTAESDAGSTRLAGSPSGLDPQLSRLLGREDDLAAIRALVLADEVRMLTLTGPGGVGKTRLAVEVGGEARSHFAQGGVFVDLTTLRDPAKVLMVVGESFGFRDMESQILLERLQAYLAEQELLLILDNVEQVLSAAPRLAELLAAAPRVKLLVTSREPLHLRTEQIFHVAPLSLPDPRHLPPLERLAQVPSVALFLHRAQAIDPDFALSEENAQGVAELVVHLDGLPLAIELAAARTALLSPQMILERLGQRLSLLRWQAQDLPQRQHTLRSAIAWSYDLLSPEEQTVFRRLGVFTGSFSLHAAESIAETLRVDAIEALASLVDKSLVQVQGMDVDNVRYILLESVREYALERLAEAGELEEAGRVHALYYLTLAERAEPELIGREQQYWFSRLEWAHENLRTALHWLLDHDEGECALRMATALGYFWEASGHYAEGRRQLEEALARAPHADPRLRARALSRLGALLVWVSGESEGPRAVLTEALEFARDASDLETAALSLTYLGILDRRAEEWDRSRRHLQEALTYWKELGHQWGIAYVFFYLGGIELRQGHDETGLRLLEESLTRYRAIGDSSAGGLPLFYLAYRAGEQGDVRRGIEYVRELFELSIQSHHGRLLYLSGIGLARLLREQAGTPWVPEQLGRLLGAAQQLLEMMGGALDTNFTGKLFATTAETLRVRLGQEGMNVALAQGRALTSTQMSALIREVLDREAQDGALEEVAQDIRQPSLLSPREHEVLLLVSEGLSNKQIAKRLFIAESTAKSYVTGVFNKLGVDTRAHAVAVAAQRGLLEPRDS